MPDLKNPIRAEDVYLSDVLKMLVANVNDNGELHLNSFQSERLISWLNSIVSVMKMQEHTILAFQRIVFKESEEN
jgi:hypothetical protein